MVLVYIIIYHSISFYHVLEQPPGWRIELCISKAEDPPHYPPRRHGAFLHARSTGFPNGQGHPIRADPALGASWPTCQGPKHVKTLWTSGWIKRSEQTG